ncbi:unnamed protein product [Tuber melanosporum]|uniref:(Perigord truffle) hypothetical protein n=1 Tax=Tuber melanosporum (strain Mel28) TaxID=656061 RepID=D5GMG8_TUBMM|nr:unnamed protein product [Tuber melanosporum]
MDQEATKQVPQHMIRNEDQTNKIGI